MNNTDYRALLVGAKIKFLDNDEMIEALNKAIELLDAERDGRCVVLPCKAGDVVYLIKDKSIVMCEVKKFYYGIGKCKYVRLKPFLQPMLGNHSVYYKIAISKFGKSIFLLKEQAEKALSEIE